MLYAESCLELGIPLRVLLPFPKEEFQKDFDSDTWSRAEQVMQKAVTVEIIGDPSPRDERYYECGIETVQQSQIFIALWNGEPAQGHGGTAEIVTFAKAINRPVVWIHSVSGEVQVFNEQAYDRLNDDHEMRLLNQLPDAGATLEDMSSTALAKAWLEKIDNNASGLAPQVRRMAAIPIVCTASAALASGTALRLPMHGTTAAVGAALGFLAGVLPALLKLGPRQTQWARTRTAAEISRSVVCLWGTPVRYQVVGAETVPELGGMLRSLNLLKALNGLPDGQPIQEFKEAYLRERVAHQMGYFSKHALRSEQEAKKYRRVSRACVGIAIGLTVWNLVSVSALHLSGMASAKLWLTLTASLLFQVATVAGALLIVNDCDRRQRRYYELSDSLKEWEKELRALQAWGPLLKVVVRIEKALLAEILEWKSLIRNTKMPRS
jgi:hypothetical protein